VTAATSARPSVGTRAWLAAWTNPLTTFYLLVGSTVLLLLLGLVMVLSSSAVDSIVDGGSPYAPFLTQAKYALIGLPVMFVASRLTADTHRRVAPWLLLAALVFQSLVYVPALGRGAGGNTGWVYLGGFSAQPSEAVKLALAVWLGVVLARKQALLHEVQHVLVPAVAGAGVAIFMVILGKDLGTTMIVGLLVFGALFVAGVPWKTLAGLAGTAGLGVLLFLATQSGSNRGSKIQNWLGECTDTQGLCYQVEHGTWALASGGLLGVGLGQSKEKWSYLPAAHNDFIFAIIGEELGLAGTLLVLGLFAVLGAAMLRIMRFHPDPAARITTGAIFAWVIGQALLNIAVVLKMAPVIGVPLPLVSAGGSALITTMAALGVVISFARTDPPAAAALASNVSAVRRSIAVMGRGRG
jgi:cell division protein FtsW